MAEKEQEEAELAAASAVMFDDRPPGPVRTPHGCAGDDDQPAHIAACTAQSSLCTSKHAYQA